MRLGMRRGHIVGNTVAAVLGGATEVEIIEGLMEGGWLQQVRDI